MEPMPKSLNRPYLLLTSTALFWSRNLLMGRAIRPDVPPIVLAWLMLGKRVGSGEAAGMLMAVLAWGLCTVEPRWRPGGLASRPCLASFTAAGLAVLTPACQFVGMVMVFAGSALATRSRSEEHTSELQSPLNLVC